VSWTPLGPALLFCPADRPDRFAKAAAVADMVILDLEDGVNAGDRVVARRAVIDNLLDPQRTILRVNPVGSADFALDLEALDQTPYSLVMLAKTESSVQVDALAGREVIALCETAAGVLESSSIAAAASTIALMWGAEDLLASLAGVRVATSVVSTETSPASPGPRFSSARARTIERRSTQSTSTSPTSRDWAKRRATPRRRVFARPPAFILHKLTAYARPIDRRMMRLRGPRASSAPPPTRVVSFVTRVE